MKAVIYARVSTEDQVEGASLENQVKTCREYCKRHDYTVLAEFREDVSGAEVNRLELDKVIKLADSFDVLVVYSVDRFAREMEVHYILEKELKEKGARVEFAVGDFTDTPEGQLYKNMTMAFAQFERAQILRRTVSGLQARARSGRVTHAQTPPYGYDYEDGYFEINEEQAAVIQQIFEWYTVHKYSGHKIAKLLTSKGVPTSHEIYGYEKIKPGWGPSSIMKILGNEVYYGCFSFGDIEIDVPPIIDRKTYKRAQKQRAANQHFAKRNTKYDYLLRGRLYCAVCGGLMFGVTKKRKYKNKTYTTSYYRCANMRDKNPRLQPCRGTVKVEPLDERAWAFVEDVITNTEHHIKEWQRRVSEGDYESIEKTIADNSARIKVLQQERGRLLPLYQKGYYTEEELDGLVTYINEQIETLEQNNERLAEMPGMTVYDLSKDEFIQEWRGMVDNLDFEQKRQIIDVLNIQAYALRLGNGEALLQIEGDYDGIPLAYCD